jgi:ubiquitin carboxyl-terminal hydrolase 36/42
MQSKSPTVHHSSQKQQDGSRRVIQFVTAKKSVNASISAVAASNENKKEQFVFSSPNPGTAAKTPSTKQNSQNPSSTPLNGDKKCNAGVVGTASINTETGLFPMNVVTKYLRWNSLHRVGPGFHNEGNTCFLNSTLQCLLYLAPFSQCLLDESALALKNISKANTDERKHERTVIELYNNLVKDVWQGSHAGRAIAPKGMISCIRRVGKQFKPFRQEDAHEYLRQLLDCMHEEILKFNRLKTSDGKKAETSVVSRVFGGYLCNTLTCTRCQYTSKTYNHFQDLSLEIRQGINSVSDAIQAFTKIENLTQGNEWKCDGCKNKVKVNLNFCSVCCGE